MPIALEPVVFVAENVAQTKAFGAKLATILTKGDVVFLLGDLGAGKTSFAGGCIGALGPDESEITSPTYNLVHVYDGDTFAIWHADLYRLDRADQLMELGLDDAFAGALSLIEWPDRMGNMAPDSRLDILFEILPNGRKITLRPSDASWRKRLDAL